MELMEAVVDTLMRVFEEQLPATLQQIESASHGEYRLRPPGAYLDYEPSGLGEIPAEVWLALLPGDTIINADTGYSGPGGSGWMDATHEVGVMVHVQDTDPSVLTRRLLRYQRAIFQVIGANRVGVLDRDGADAWHGIAVVRTAMGNRFYPNNAEVNAYHDYCVVVVRAQRQEA
jgi:hypothetical protein